MDSYLEGRDVFYYIEKNIENANALAANSPDKSVGILLKMAELTAKFYYLAAHNEQLKNMSIADICADPAVSAFVNNEDMLDTFRNINESGKRLSSDNGQVTPEDARRDLEQFKSVFGEVARLFGFEIFFPDKNEVIEFKHKPADANSLKPIQAYFAFLGMLALKATRKKPFEKGEGINFKYFCTLTIHGKNGYTTTSLDDFIRGVIFDLPSSDGFTIESNYYGPSLNPFYDTNCTFIRDMFENKITEIGESEKFTYKAFEYNFTRGAGEGECKRFKNGMCQRFAHFRTSLTS